MKVKNRILITVIPVMVLFVILLNISFGMFFQNFIERQEENQISIAADSLSTYISDRLMKSQGNVNDWGHWDETYHFVETKNTEYIQNNIIESTFGNLDLNFIIFVDSDDNITYQKYYGKKRIYRILSGFSNYK
jgi:sensor domain CHASE-containing protein